VKYLIRWSAKSGNILPEGQKDEGHLPALAGDQDMETRKIL